MILYRNTNEAFGDTEGLSDITRQFMCQIEEVE